MTLNKAKDKIQQKAVESWNLAGKRGTCEIATGVGKTFIALHALYTMSKNTLEKHLFLAETIERRKDFMEQVALYNKIFDRNVFMDYNISFWCYQAVYRWKDVKIGLVIADEIHESLTPVYSNFYFNNDIKAIIGLSAKIDETKEYIDIYNQTITKGELLHAIAPICFIYTLQESLDTGTSRPLNIHIIKTKLNSVDKNVKAGNTKKRFFQTEKAAYTYLNKMYNAAFNEKNYIVKNKKIKEISLRRARFLYNLKSKITITKRLLDKLDSKTIVFGNSIDSLLQITPNTISSRNSEKVNESIREQFELNLINIIGSFKKLKQGANLNKELDNCIIMSFYSSDGDLIQRLGRLRLNDKMGDVFILVTEGTKEEEWFNTIYKNLEGFNINFYNNVEECINTYKQHE